MSSLAGRLRGPRPPTALPVEADELAQGALDDFVVRNRDALNESIARSRAEVTEGVEASRTIDEIVRDGRRRHPRS